MATITNSTAIQTLSLLRSSGILGFEKLPLSSPSSLEIEKDKANYYLFRLSLLGANQTRGIIDSQDLQAVNTALQEKGKKPLSERQILNLAGEFQRKFGVSFPMQLSNGRLWDPAKIKDPSQQEIQNLAQALQGNSIGPERQVITIHKTPDHERDTTVLRKTDILLTFLQNSGLAQKDGEMIAWIKPEEVISIQADFHHHSSLRQGFEVDGKTVVYRIVYEEKGSKESKWLEVEVKSFAEYQRDPNANGYLKILAKKTEELIKPKLKL